MGIDSSARSRQVSVDVQFKNFQVGKVSFLPQKVALIGQGATASTYVLDSFSATSSAEVAARYGFGSPLHLASKEMFPLNGDGIRSIPVTIYPLDDDGSGVAAAGDITASGTQTAPKDYIIKVNEIPTGGFQLATGVTASAAITTMKTALDAVLDVPLTTGANTGVELVLDLTSKWKGESANDIFVEIDGVEAGITFVVTQLVNGAVNPDIDIALAKINPNWESIICNLLNYDDTATLTKLATYGEGRWLESVKQPLFSVVGTDDNRATRTVITDARKTDRINVLLPSPGTNELPSNIAARAVTRIAVTANNNPPQNYKDRLTGIVPGPDTSQETGTERELSLQAGSGTTILIDGEIELNDTITMYHPDGDPLPAYRYVVDIVRLQNVVYNMRGIFESPEWKGAPLLPNNTPTTNKTAKKPKDALTAMGNLATNLALAGIISDPDFTKENMSSTIDNTNNKRLNNVFPIKLSGNTEIIDNTVYFGFYFGS